MMCAICVVLCFCCYYFICNINNALFFPSVFYVTFFQVFVPIPMSFLLFLPFRTRCFHRFLFFLAVPSNAPFFPLISRCLFILPFLVACSLHLLLFVLFLTEALFKTRFSKLSMLLTRNNLDRIKMVSRCAPGVCQSIREHVCVREDSLEGT